MPCFCERKGGFMLSGSTVKKESPINRDRTPIYQIFSDSAYASEAFLDNVEFKNFLANTACGGKQSIFFRNEFSRDYIAPHFSRNAKFTDVDTEGFFYMEPAPIEWAVTDACGDFPCTAPKNTVLSFQSNVFAGTEPAF